ncbi:hypothetical protein PUN28_010775 [Cardiocondyla obscurior]|uniref:Uncharacterized protein n=1 Tax=Cardiocondyla obscurior TaxID=286306 RepID=A0AAW2FJ80_9HYME
MYQDARGVAPRRMTRRPECPIMKDFRNAQRKRAKPKSLDKERSGLNSYDKTVDWERERGRGSCCDNEITRMTEDTTIGALTVRQRDFRGVRATKRPSPRRAARRILKLRCVYPRYPRTPLKKRSDVDLRLPYVHVTDLDLIKFFFFFFFVNTTNARPWRNVKKKKEKKNTKRKKHFPAGVLKLSLFRRFFFRVLRLATSIYAEREDDREREEGDTLRSAIFGLNIAREDSKTALPDQRYAASLPIVTELRGKSPIEFYSYCEKPMQVIILRRRNWTVTDRAISRPFGRSRLRRRRNEILRSADYLDASNEQDRSSLSLSLSAVSGRTISPASNTAKPQDRRVSGTYRTLRSILAHATFARWHPTLNRFTSPDNAEGETSRRRDRLSLASFSGMYPSFVDGWPRDNLDSGIEKGRTLRITRQIDKGSALAFLHAFPDLARTHRRPDRGPNVHRYTHTRPSESAVPAYHTCNDPVNLNLRRSLVSSRSECAEVLSDSARVLLNFGYENAAEFQIALRACERIRADESLCRHMATAASSILPQTFNRIAKLSIDCCLISHSKNRRETFQFFPLRSRRREMRIWLVELFRG